MVSKILCAIVFYGGLLAAQTTFQVSGTVHDGVGRAVDAATVTLAPEGSGAPITATSDAAGAFHLAAAAGGYVLRVGKPGFADATLPVQVAGAMVVPVTLDLAKLQQQLVVAATSVPTPQTQLGQSVEVADQATIQTRAALTADATLRDMTGVQVNRNGAVGGLTSVMLRGGDPSFVKILLDGVPVQRFDFGAFDFSTLTPEALDSITVVRGADSVVYGSDAASGVIDIVSRSGAGVGAPELTMSTVGGSFGTTQQSDQLLGNWGRLDYGFTFGYLDTQNQLPNNKFWNQSWTGNLGFRLPQRTQLRLNLRRSNARSGEPNAFNFFGIPDDSFGHQDETYASANLRQQTLTKWTNAVTVSQSAINYEFATLAPSGTLDPNFGNYLGRPVTITGANGTTAMGQAILDYAGTYPQFYNSDTVGRYVTATSTYELAPLWNLVGGYRYSNERGDSAPRSSWHNNGAFVELTGGMWNRLFGSAGASEDSHSLFGNTFNPQASLAFLPRLGRTGWWNELRLHANAGTAQKDPSIAQNQSSLYSIALQAGGAAAAAPFTPIHPERAHTFDLGADQYLANDRVRLGVTWFDDRYDDLIQFVPTTAFGLLGLSSAASNTAQAFGGAYLNSLSESSKGAEFEMRFRAARGWHAATSYTYLVPVVLRSFSSDALYPSYNPAYPTVAIGAYSPLVGARPFNVAPESGSVSVGYDHPRWSAEASLNGSSRRDGSTFLSDANFGPSLLLPNHDLAPAYAVTNLSGFYRWTRYLSSQAVIDNAFNKSYQETFGYPALGRAVRVGIVLTLTPPRSK